MQKEAGRGGAAASSDLPLRLSRGSPARPRGPARRRWRILGSGSRAARSRGRRAQSPPTRCKAEIAALRTSRIAVIAQGLPQEVDRALAVRAGERVQRLHAQLGVVIAERPLAQQPPGARPLEPGERGDRPAAHQGVVLRGEDAREDVGRGARLQRADLGHRRHALGLVGIAELGQDVVAGRRRHVAVRQPERLALAQRILAVVLQGAFVRLRHGLVSSRLCRRGEIRILQHPDLGQRRCAGFRVRIAVADDHRMPLRQLPDGVLERPVGEGCADRRGERPAQHHLEPAAAPIARSTSASGVPSACSVSRPSVTTGLDAGGRRALGGCILGRGSRDQSQKKAGRQAGLPKPVSSARQEQHVSLTLRTDHPTPLCSRERGKQAAPRHGSGTIAIRLQRSPCGRRTAGVGRAGATPARFSPARLVPGPRPAAGLARLEHDPEPARAALIRPSSRKSFPVRATQAT